MVLTILTKKHVRNVLELLNERGEMYLSEIQTELGIDSGNLSTLLNNLVKEKLLEKRKEPLGESIGKSYFMLTKIGKKAVKVYKWDEELEEEINDVKFHNEINGDVGQVINIDKADGLEINFKKGK
ncbi:MarR family transcriptional regulator [Methanococcus sp. CF]